MLSVTIENKKEVIPDTSTYYDLALEYEKKYNKIPMMVNVNGEIKELRRHAKESDNITFLFYNDESVADAYARTAIFILLKSIYEVCGKDVDAAMKFRIHHAYYFELEGKEVSNEMADKIRETFDANVNSKIKILKNSYSKKDAYNIFEKEKMYDTKLLFKYVYRKVINLRSIDGYIRYINDPLLYDTSYIKYYDIRKYKRGLLLTLPYSNDIKNISYVKPAEKLFNIHNDSVNWAKKLKINTVGKLNQAISDNRFDDLVIMTESLQDKQIGDIADEVIKSKCRLLLIDGPTSSGKTSFAKRLIYHLRALEYNPFPLSCDDFFKEREKTPKKPDGTYDFESIDAIDIKLFNKIVDDLLSGKEVVLPKFDFANGKKLYNDKAVNMKKNDILIMEGINCLNPKLLTNKEDIKAFKIYVSALTEVSIDGANRIATSDLRLIRRIIRDARTRGYNSEDTLRIWKNVRLGEEKNIFPFQEEANIFFNSALIYEFSVIKSKVLPMLYKINEDSDVYNLAQRIIKTLNFFLDVETDCIPSYSIIREFIGKSSLNVN